VNRTAFRGLTAALVAGAVVASVGVVGTALAAGAGPGGDRPGVPAQAAGRATAAVVAASRVAVQAAAAARRTVSAPARRPGRASRSNRRLSLLGSPRTIAHALLLRRGWSEAEWGCLDALWTRESNWSVTASNGGSGAYGIPQALPGSKMATMGSDWRTDALTQIRWGLSYIARSYGDPCSALGHSDRYGYY
jgi:hypothetical protein